VKKASYPGSASRSACSAAARSPESCLLPASFREAHAVVRWFGCRELRLAPLRHGSGGVQASLRPKISAVLTQESRGLGVAGTKLLEGVAPQSSATARRTPSIDATNGSRRSESPKGSPHRTASDAACSPPIYTPTAFHCTAHTPVHPHTRAFDAPPRQRAGRTHVANRRAARMGRRARAPDVPRLLQGARPYVRYVSASMVLSPASKSGN
jgi:hypothetical protein